MKNTKIKNIIRQTINEQGGIVDVYCNPSNCICTPIFGTGTGADCSHWRNRCGCVPEHSGSASQNIVRSSACGLPGRRLEHIATQQTATRFALDFSWVKGSCFSQRSRIILGPDNFHVKRFVEIIFWLDF